jgi:signal peptidase I
VQGIFFETEPEIGIEIPRLLEGVRLEIEHDQLATGLEDAESLVDGALRVNGVRAPREAVPGPCRYANRGEDGTWTDDSCADFVEELDGHRYHSYCTPGVPCGDVGEVKVPAGMVWLAGDHRDRSADSRVFGPVPVGRIKGRAWLVVASWGPHGPRWSRAFESVKH